MLHISILYTFSLSVSFSLSHSLSLSLSVSLSVCPSLLILCRPPTLTPCLSLSLPVSISPPTSTLSSSLSLSISLSLSLCLSLSPVCCSVSQVLFSLRSHLCFCLEFESFNLLPEAEDDLKSNVPFRRKFLSARALWLTYSVAHAMCQDTLHYAHTIVHW